MNQNELIDISIQPDGAAYVDARALHEFLQSKTGFSHWIRRKIKQYGFQKNVDFIAEVTPAPDDRGRPTTEYRITIDTAKQLAMVDESPKGRFIRLWFIERDNILRRAGAANLAAAPEGTELSPMLTHRDHFDHLILKGVPPATACRSADQLVRSLCLTKKPEPLPGKEKHLGTMEEDLATIMAAMKPGKSYRVPDLVALLPTGHAMLRKSVSKPALNSYIGKVMGIGVGRGLIKRPHLRLIEYFLA